MLSPSTLAFSTGKAARASIVAFTMNGRYVSLTPRCSNEWRCSARRRSTRLMSISNTVVTWAEVRFETTMCSAVFFRIGDIGTTGDLSAPVRAGGAAAVAREGRLAAAGGAVAGRDVAGGAGIGGGATGGTGAGRGA